MKGCTCVLIVSTIPRSYQGLIVPFPAQLEGTLGATCNHSKVLNLIRNWKD